MDGFGDDQRRRLSLRFGDVADVYDRARPAYAPEAIDWVLGGRRDVLLGKNLACAPLALALGTILVSLIEVVQPMRVDHFLDFGRRDRGCSSRSGRVFVQRRQAAIQKPVPPASGLLQRTPFSKLPTPVQHAHFRGVRTVSVFCDRLLLLT